MDINIYILINQKFKRKIKFEYGYIKKIRRNKRR